MDGGVFTIKDHAFPDYWAAQHAALEQVAVLGAPVAVLRVGAESPIATVTQDTVRLLRASFTLLGLVVAGEHLPSLPRIEEDGGVGIVWSSRGDFIELRLEPGGTWSLSTVTGGRLTFVGTGSVDEELPDDVLLTMHGWLMSHSNGGPNGHPNHLREMWEAVGCGVF